MTTSEELPDEGQVSVEKGMTIGYFDQDVGEMAGHSAVAEVMEGAGPVSAVAAELRERAPLTPCKVKGELRSSKRSTARRAAAPPLGGCL
ncbi:ATPase subunit of ABC transporter with duplicated ATPase domains [Sinorhizobium kostiense]|uniref:ATPase subunit of ABC transporter with duplicated ATPase domains n=1 Tax=Sinorhizobium kostiense TaxID=76747 RepID=A0ABS4R071_9HYPH|nr:ATPase subunit of ABC transporter with duplicated ATPase domains [Sinorhizobium kostiense]